MKRHPLVWMALLSWLLCSEAHGAWTVNMAPGATEVSQKVFDLHMTIFWICVLIGIVVFGAMFWSMLMHRRRPDRVAASFHESTTVEVLWTLVPLLILIAMAIPATRTLLEIYDSSESDLDIQVTAYQWKWHYKYLGQDVEFFSNLATPSEQIRNLVPKDEHYLLEVDQPLVLPAGEKIRFLVTAADVITRGGCPLSRSSATPFPALSTKPGPRSTNPASTAASAPSCAARTTASCPSWSRSRASPTSISGWPRARPRPCSSRS
jgi:cytochrome c oxidase subunit 2